MNVPARRFVATMIALVSLTLVTVPASGHGAVVARTRRPGGDACSDVLLTHGRGGSHSRDCPQAGSSNGIAKGDFNGDGFADLAVGMPGEDTPASQKDSGAVVVIYGSANGLTATDPGVPASQFWSQNSPGIPGASEAGDRFGSALASGNFNGDKYSDLAIGIPNEDSSAQGFESFGRVVIIYGSSAGLTASTASGVPAPQSFALGNFPVGAGILELGVNLDSFGTALAWGDFDGDGFGDLAIGDPRLNIPGDFFHTEGFRPGAVCVMYGTEAGLTTARNQFWLQSSIQSNSNDGDLFGAALAGADFDGDGRTDLAIGLPGRSEIGASAVGAVTVIKGSSTGLTATGSRFIDRAVTGVIDEADAGDRFGWSLAAGDFNGDQRADLAVGVPFDNLGSASDAGSVQLFVGSSSGLAISGNTILTQSLVFGANSVQEAGDQFGFALASGDFNGDARADLAIGVPFEDLITTVDAGEVDVIYGSDSGLTRTSGPGSQSWHQSFAGITTLAGDAEAHDRFGLTLTAWNFGKNFTSRTNPLKVFAYADLAIGVPFEGLISPSDGVTPLANAGAVNVIYGSPDGLTLDGNDLWTQDDAGVPGAAEPGDEFGLGLY